jgi:Ca2+-binding RTX toxin-like protein
MVLIVGKDDVNDTLLNPFLPSNDMIDGKSGFDTVYGYGAVVDARLATPILINGKPVLAGPGYANSGFQHDKLISIEGIIGSSFNDTLVGGNSDNSLIGKLGNDTLNGLAGNDFLDGGNDSDILNGGNGNDSLVGGEGNDTLDGGIDNDILDGAAGDDSLVGGTGDDELYGGGGIDTLTGGEGDDIYDISFDDADSVIEAVNEGIDIINSAGSMTLPDNVENLALTSYREINGTGNALNNTIKGNIANNSLTGGAGNDTLTGGMGADSFVFNSFTEAVDSITDFAPLDDTIRVKASGFGGGLTPGAISIAQFHLGEAAADGSDRFIYNRTGTLFFDADGTGSAFGQVAIATLTGAPLITAANIVII